ncbi:MAG: hypothetical protein ACREV0_10095, partial [Burkholderiales bacterium]
RIPPLVKEIQGRKSWNSALRDQLVQHALQGKARQDSLLRGYQGPTGIYVRRRSGIGVLCNGSYDGS